MRSNHFMEIMLLIGVVVHLGYKIYFKTFINTALVFIWNLAGYYIRLYQIKEHKSEIQLSIYKTEIQQYISCDCIISNALNF